MNGAAAKWPAAGAEDRGEAAPRSTPASAVVASPRGE